MGDSDLEALTITKMRGFVKPFTLTFERNKKLCIVYGENGTGKSTLCDALDLLGSESIGSLDGRGLGKVERYLAPLNHAAAVGAVELKTTGADAYTATIQGGRVTVMTPRPRVLVLRRPQLVKIVNALPADRYKEIAELVDVSGVSNSEQALSNLLKQTARDAEERATRVAGAKEILEKLFAAAAGEGDAIAWARREATRDSADSNTLADALGALKKAYETLQHRRERYDLARANVKSAKEDKDAAAAEVKALDHGDDNTSPELVALLEAAEKALATRGEGNVCPVCSGTDKAIGLAARLRERLAAMARLRAALARETSATRNLELAQARELEEREAYLAERTSFQPLRRGIAEEVRPDSDPPEDLNELSCWLEQLASLAAEWNRRHIELSGLADHRQRLRDALSAYNESYTLAERASKLVRALRAGHAKAQSTRHTFVNGVLEEISREVGRLYDVVHPGEGFEKINLSLDTKKRESLSLSANFQTSQVPPQAYFSDSHLDTLGLCIFLALAKKGAASSTILVLDDVLASVDEPHVDRLIEAHQEIVWVQGEPCNRGWRSRLPK